jgi:hypothetical protein
MANSANLEKGLDVLSSKELDELLGEKEEKTTLVKCSEYLNNRLNPYGVQLWIRDSDRLNHSTDSSIKKQNKIIDFMLIGLDFKEITSSNIVKIKKQNKLILAKEIEKSRISERKTFGKTFANICTITLFIIIFIINSLVNLVKQTSSSFISFLLIGGIIGYFININNKKKKRLILNSFVVKTIS